MKKENVVFFLLFFLIGIWWYFWYKFKILKYLELLSVFNILFIFGRGYIFFLVILFSLWKLMYMWILLFFFGIRMIGVEYGFLDGCMILLVYIVFIWDFSNFCWLWGILYGCKWMGLLFFVFIEWLIKLVLFNLLLLNVKIFWNLFNIFIIDLCFVWFKFFVI